MHGVWVSWIRCREERCNTSTGTITNAITNTNTGGALSRHCIAVSSLPSIPRVVAEGYMAKNAGNPQKVADAVCEGLTSHSPRDRYS